MNTSRWRERHAKPGELHLGRRLRQRSDDRHRLDGRERPRRQPAQHHLQQRGGADHQHAPRPLLWRRVRRYQRGDADALEQCVLLRELGQRPERRLRRAASDPFSQRGQDRSDQRQQRELFHALVYGGRAHRRARHLALHTAAPGGELLYGVGRLRGECSSNAARRFNGRGAGQARRSVVA